MAAVTTPQRNPIVYALFGVNQRREAVRLVPGTALAMAVMAVAVPLAELAGQTVLRLQGIDLTGKASPISGVLMAIVLGMVLATLGGLPE